MFKIIKKLVKVVFIVALLAAVLLFGSRLVTRIYFANRVKDIDQIASEEKKDCILVLGAGVYSDGSLSPVLLERMEMAVKAYEKGLSDTVFVTGDHRVGEYDEVDHMVEYLVVHGVPEEKIQFDYNGFSTYESMWRAANVFHFSSAYVVTQDFHLYRALMVGESYGMDCVGIKADQQMFANTVYWELREIPATIKDWFACIMRQEVSQ